MHSTKVLTAGAVEVMYVLSPREAEVLAHVAIGKLNKEIAAELGLTEGTVKEYLYSMMRGLHLRNRVELAAWAFLHPHALGGCAAPAGLHPAGCACQSSYCVIRRRDVA